jgi:hypothetical protein
MRIPSEWGTRLTVAVVLTSLALMPRIGGAIDGGPPPPRFPDACPASPGAQPIAGLITGQMLTTGELVTLRFSSKRFTCGDWNNDVTTSDCRSFWNLTLTVPRSAMSVGVHKLSAIGAQFGDLVATLHPQQSRGCGGDECGGSTSGVGSVAITEPSATLEIYSMAGGCIAGKLYGLSDPFLKDGPNFNGDFFALTCGP